MNWRGDDNIEDALVQKSTCSPKTPVRNQKFQTIGQIFVTVWTNAGPQQCQIQYGIHDTAAAAYRLQNQAYLQACDFVLCLHFCYKLQEKWIVDSCREQGQHQENRHQIVKIVITECANLRRKFLFWEYIQKQHKGFLFHLLCSTYAAFLDIFLQPDVPWRAGWVCQVQQIRPANICWDNRVSALPSRSKEVGIGETLHSFTGKLFLRKVRQILQNIQSEYYLKCSNYLSPTYSLFYQFPFCKYS